MEWYMVLLIVVVILIWMIPVFTDIKIWYNKKYKEMDRSKMFECIHCKEAILGNAKYCQHCGKNQEPEIGKKVAIRVGVIIMLFFFCRYIYGMGFEANKPLADDGSPIVYITPTGSKYHSGGCDYLTKNNKIEISVNRAREKNYSPCSACSAKYIE